MQASLCCEDPGVHGGDALEGCLPPSCLAAFFLALVIYLRKYNHKCMSQECLESVCMFYVHMTKSLLYRTSEEAFLGTAS